MLIPATEDGAVDMQDPFEVIISEDCIPNDSQEATLSVCIRAKGML